MRLIIIPVESNILVMNKNDIKPLRMTRSNNALGKGRPSKYYEGMANDYDRYRECGIRHYDILDAWCISERDFDRWAASKPSLGAIAQKWSDVGIKEAVDDDGEPIPATYDECVQAGAIKAINALTRIVDTARNESARVAAARELLDRAKGKPVQTTHVQQHMTYTIMSAIPAPPNSAGALCDESAPTLPVIDEEPLTPQPEPIDSTLPPWAR